MNNNQSRIEIEEEKQQKEMVLDVETIHKLFKYKNGSDVVALYVFYHKQSKMQKTNMSWSLKNFCMKGLGWGDKRFKKAKKALKELGLVEDFTRRNEEGKIIGHYVHLKYIKSHNKANLSSGVENHPVDEATSGYQETNAGSSKTLNAGSSKTEMLCALGNKKETNPTLTKEQKEKHFKYWWDKYPIKKAKKEAKAKYMKVLKEVSPQTLLEALEEQKKEWALIGKVDRFIPSPSYPTTWLNGGRWEDEVEKVIKTPEKDWKERGRDEMTKFRQEYGDKKCMDMLDLYN